MNVFFTRESLKIAVSVSVMKSLLVMSVLDFSGCFKPVFLWPCEAIIGSALCGLYFIVESLCICINSFVGFVFILAKGYWLYA